MTENRQVAITLSIPEQCLERLRIMAAKSILRDPSHVTTASTIAKEIICKALDKMDSESDD